MSKFSTAGFKPSRAALLRQARELWEQTGAGTTPLRFGSKKARREDCYTGTSDERWEGENYSTTNFGVVPNGIIIAIDTDDAATTLVIRRLLKALGLRPLVTIPPAGGKNPGGRHFWLVVRDVPAEINSKKFKWANLAPEIGKGELRARDCHLAEAPSKIRGAVYSFEDGGQPSDLMTMPAVDWHKIAHLLPKEIDSTTATTTAAPSNGKRWRSEKAQWLLRGGNIKRYHYPSRSEAEQGLIASLISTGHEKGEILKLMCQYPGPGKFTEKRKASEEAALRYFEGTYAKARKHVDTTTPPGMLLAQAARRWVDTQQWKGHKANMDQRVLVAYLDVMEQSGREQFGVAVRRLAEMTGTSTGTVRTYTQRLIDQGLIARIDQGTMRASATFKLGYRLKRKAGTMAEGSKTYTIKQVPLPPVFYCAAFTTHDAFRFRGLNSTGAAMWAALLSRPMTVMELVTATGICETTVRNKLNQKMAKITAPDTETGEIVPMAYQTKDGRWHANAKIDLDRIAREVGTSGASDRQRKQHLNDRRLRDHGLALLAAQPTNYRNGSPTAKPAAKEKPAEGSKGLKTAQAPNGKSKLVKNRRPT